METFEFSVVLFLLLSSECGVSFWTISYRHDHSVAVRVSFYRWRQLRLLKAADVSANMIVEFLTSNSIHTLKIFTIISILSMEDGGVDRTVITCRQFGRMADLTPLLTF